MLSGPLRDRFHIREHLGFYSLEELTEIVLRSAKKLGVAIENEAAIEIAGRSRSTPRIANLRLRWVRDFAEIKALGADNYVLLEAIRSGNVQFMQLPPDGTVAVPSP